MKNILLLLIALSITVALKAQNNTNELPAKASTFINNHFANNKIVKIKIDYEDNECEVKLDNNCELKFDLQGDWSEIESDFAPLPKSVIDLLPKPCIEYIAMKYPRRAILKIEKERSKYEVELSNSLELIFDKNGKFLRID